MRSLRDLDFDLKLYVLSNPYIYVSSACMPNFINISHIFSTSIINLLVTGNKNFSLQKDEEEEPIAEVDIRGL